MRAPITTLCFFLTLSLFGQVNDADTFFSGNYDKAFICSRKVKQVTVETYINETKSSLSEFTFDSNGFLTKQTVVDSSGTMVNDYLFTYNPHGDQIERKNIAADLSKTYVVSFSKIYNGSQLLQETSSDLPFVTTHTYDASGKKVQSTIFLTPDTTTSAKRIFLYTYNGKGRLTGMEETYTENNGSIPIHFGKTTYVYDTAGNITNVIREGKANYVFSYNRDGLVESKAINMPEEFGNVKMVDRYSYTFWK